MLNGDGPPEYDWLDINEHPNKAGQEFADAEGSNPYNVFCDGPYNTLDDGCFRRLPAGSDSDI